MIERETPNGSLQRIRQLASAKRYNDRTERARDRGCNELYKHPATLYVCKSTLYNKLCGMQLVACVSRWSKDITESAIYTLRIYKNSFPFSVV